VVFEDFPDGGCSDVVADLGESSVDSPVSPCWVVGGHLNDESADFGVGWWPSGFVGWLGPVFGGASAMPAKQSVWCDEPSVAASPGECLGYRCKHRSVVIVEVGSGVLSVQDAELVAQDHYLQVFGAARPNGDAGQRSEEAVQNAIHKLRIGPDFPCSTATAEYWAPTPHKPLAVFL
jgi:hypothetical protein